MDVAIAERLLLEIKEVMDLLGVQFFLRQGTCLGAVRENAFIPWDDDVDLGVILETNGFTEQSIEPLLTAFRETGFFVQAESSDSLIYASLLKYDVRVDLIFHRVIDQQIYHFPGIWFPFALFNHLKEIDFIGKTFLVPNPPEEYLRIKYGADWQTPKRLDYARDVVKNIPMEHVPGLLERIKRAVAGFLYPGNTARLMVLDEKCLPVQGANVRIVGVGNFKTNKHGHAKLYLQTEGPYSLMASGVSDVGSMYAIVISYGDHEEVLYEEIIAPTESYVYRPDSAQTEGRIFVLSQE
jgi:hypothetical protein